MSNTIGILGIDGFRGASQPFTLEFDEKKPVTLIFGENGTGKSTLVDAIECIANGSTSFKENWKLGAGKRKDAFIPTLGKKPDEVTLTLVYGGQTFNSTSANDTAHAPAVRVLRRKSLQAFIEADAAQRYKEVANFLDIPQIAAAEDSLRTAAKQARDAVNIATAAQEQAEESLNEHWEAAGNPGQGDKYQNAEQWARQEAQANTEQLTADKAKLKNQISMIEELARKSTSYTATKAPLKHAEQQQEETQQNLDKLEAEATKGSNQLVTLLKDAKTYLSATPDTLCPVCEQAEIEPGTLVQRLDQRLADMDALSQAGNAQQSAAKNLANKQTLHIQAANELLTAAGPALEIFGQDFGQTKDFENHKDDNSLQAADIALALNEKISLQLPKLQQDAEAIQQRLHTLTSIRQFIKTLDTKKTEVKTKDVLRGQLAKAVEIFETKRKAYVETVLQEIGDAVNALYQQIHPDEGLGELNLKLDEGKRASLDYSVKFAGHEDIMPQPYYSESHLDTLGLCIFLALAKRNAGEDAVIVLDDVLGSVDQQHIHRTVDMLIEASTKLAQIIITTHYRPLRNRFTNSRTGSSKVKLVDLKPWTLADGLRYTTPKLAVDELEALLIQDPLPRDHAAIAAGRLLETAFDYLTLIYGVRMARKPEPKYDLGELFSAVRSIKNWQVTYAGNTIDIKPMLEALHPLMPVRNEAGAHYNENGELLADKDIADFGNTALTLLKTLICTDCNGLARKHDDIGHWNCECGHTTMQPYKV